MDNTHTHTHICIISTHETSHAERGVQSSVGGEGGNSNYDIVGRSFRHENEIYRKAKVCE